jgi:hypothetical protein
VSSSPEAYRRPDRITPLWLSHHYPEDYDRCVRIGRTHVCRRCVVLYPIALLVMLGTLSWHPPRIVDALALIVLPLPALCELVAEQLGLVRYRPARQVAVTVPLAIGLGRGFAVYLDDHTSLLFWGVVVLYTGLGVAAVLWGRGRFDRSDDTS